MSVILLNEIPNFKNVVGGIIIVSTVVIESIKSKEKNS
jgi:drug/metabolite transporter (DMT)-like permease